MSSLSKKTLAACALCGLLLGCGPADEQPPDGKQQFSPDAKGLIILTTKDFVSRSQVLGRFVEEKERRDLRVLVATEEQYGGAELVGEKRALRIRSYLRSVAKDYDYLLLIGDAHPEYGDVPMFRVWPRHELPSDLCLSAFALDCRFCETDFLYANLDGNWDLNGNGRYGEHKLDDGEGGIDFHADLVVGRIPVYFGDVSEGDRILEHALAYVGQTAAQAAYRRSVLLPAAYFYFKGEKMAATTVATHIDGATTAEWVVENVVKKHPGTTFRRLYERDGIAPSTYPSEGGLTQASMTRELSNGHGIVFWGGHGMPFNVVRVVWEEDSDGDGAADGSEIVAHPFLRAQDVHQIDAGRPGFAMASSCEVGSADVPYNLSHSLLLAGAVVGMVGSSSVTPGSTTASPQGTGALDEQAFGSDNAAVLVMQGLLAGKSAAEAFTAAKQRLGKSNDAEAYAGRMMLNYFGDPTLTLDDLALAD